MHVLNVSCTVQLFVCVTCNIVLHTPVCGLQTVLLFGRDIRQALSFLMSWNVLPCRCG